jgi:hypothetical protein
MESKLNRISRFSKQNFHGKVEIKELELLLESNFFKYLPEKTKKKINQVLSSAVSNKM